MKTSDGSYKEPVYESILNKIRNGSPIISGIAGGIVGIFGFDPFKPFFGLPSLFPIAIDILGTIIGIIIIIIRMEPFYRNP